MCKIPSAAENWYYREQHRQYHGMIKYMLEHWCPVCRHKLGGCKPNMKYPSQFLPFCRKQFADTANTWPVGV